MGKFNARRAPKWQVDARVKSVSKLVIQKMAKGDINKVNRGMIEKAAEKQNLPLDELIKHLRGLGANI